jgi:hypothetical protein
MNSAKSTQIKSQIQNVILTDFARVMETKESVIGKFILITVGIEFLGACLDKQHLNATARSEIRFNSAILKLFPRKYHHFVKKESVPNFYLDFRCPVIHQFRPGRSVFLCSRQDMDTENRKHLAYHTEGALILVAEDFYEDLAAAGKKLISMM